MAAAVAGKEMRNINFSILTFKQTRSNDENKNPITHITPI